MRLASMNIWATHGDWSRRRRLLADTFNDLDPDLFVLQETVAREDYDQVRDVLGDHLHVAHSTARAADGMGITTGSRWPITATRELDLQVSSRTSDFPATTLIVEVAAPTGPLLLVNHFPSWKLHLEAERCAQAVIAARAIEDIRPELDDPVIVAGDLDADPSSSSVRFWTGRHPLDRLSVCYRDAWEATHPGQPGHTYTPDNPLLVDADWPFQRVDYILVRCAEHGGPALRIHDCRIIGHDPPASDHHGLLADLEPTRTNRSNPPPTVPTEPPSGS